jgi:signal transduction histidine kinase
MRLEQMRHGIFTATMTAHELSVLLAGARMSLSVMSTDPSDSSAEARQTLESVLGAVDAALEQDRARATRREANARRPRESCSG